MTSSACFGWCSSYTLGLFFIFLVSLIWSAASILVQFLYTKESFDSPFLLTYIGVSLFSLLLPTKFAVDQTKKIVRYLYSKVYGVTVDSSSTELLEITSSSSEPQYENLPSAESNSGCLDEPARVLEMPYRDEDGSNQDDNDNDDGELRVQHSQSPASYAEEENDECDEQVIIMQMQQTTWTNAQHMKAAIMIAPVWFIANWTYNASLAYTSITSSTVLASTGSLFTFLLAVVSRDEQFTCLKFVGVLLGVMGSLFTALHDANSGSGSSNDEAAGEEDYEDGESREEATPLFFRMRMIRHLLVAPAYGNGYEGQERALFGDALGIISAVGYGCYAVMVRLICPQNESLMSMELLLGYIGLFNMVALSPILFYQLCQGNHSELTWVVFGFLVLKGMLDNVLSDYLWARSVVLTSATVATVGLGLTIPLAFLSDVLWMGQEGDQVVSVSSVAGALSVLAGFILVNAGTNLKDDNVENEQDTNGLDEEDGHQPMQLTEMKCCDRED